MSYTVVYSGPITNPPQGIQDILSPGSIPVITTDVTDRTDNRLSGGSSVSYILHSKWAFGTGGSADTDLNDNGYWTSLVGGQVNTVLTVVVAASESLSGSQPPNCTHFLRVNHQVSASPPAGQTARGGNWTSPLAGDSRYWDLYLYNNIANDEGDRNESHHPVETLVGGGNCAWQFNYTTNADGTYNFFVWTDSSHGSGANGKWFPVNGAQAIQRLPKFKWLRFKLKATKVVSNSYNFEIYVYDSSSGSDVLLYGPAAASPTLGTFRNKNGANVDVTAAPISMQDSEIDGFEVGTSGGSDLANLTRIEHTYFADIRIRSDGWDA